MTEAEHSEARLQQEALLFEYAQCQEEANSIALRTQAIIIVIYSGSVLALTSEIGSRPSWAHFAYSWIGFIISIALMAPQIGRLGPGPVRFLQHRASFTRIKMFERQREIEMELSFIIRKSSWFHQNDRSRADGEPRHKQAGDTRYLAGRPAGIALMWLGWVLAIAWAAAAVVTTLLLAANK